MNTLGIIGFGRFGQTLARILKDDFDVTVSNRSDASAAAAEIGVRYATLAEAAAKDLVILSVPISVMEAILKAISPHLRSGSLVMDTCSVKEYPLQAMQQLLPSSVEILGSHPLFGPDSVHNTAARRIVLCPVRTTRTDDIRRYFEKKGFTVIVTDPETHDRSIAYALNIPHLIGRALNTSGAKPQDISTVNYDMLLSIAEKVNNDTLQMFRDIHTYNRFATPTEDRFISELSSIRNAVTTPPLPTLPSGPVSFPPGIVAFQGEYGAYSEVAARKFFGDNVKTLPRPALKDVFHAVTGSKALYGIIPVENSTAGDVRQSYDLLIESPLSVCGELYLPIHHCLIGQEHATLRDITTVYSHYQAIAQCGKFLDRMHLAKQQIYDTAGAVKMLKEHGKKNEAAIASRLAADIYGLKVLKENIEDNPENTTRFFVITRRDPQQGDKTSIFLRTKHTPGALYRCLGVFAERNINLTKLVSHPSLRQWEYTFYLDFQGGLQDKNVQEALAALQQHAEFFHVLGSYTDQSRQA